MKYYIAPHRIVHFFNKKAIKTFCEISCKYVDMSYSVKLTNHVGKIYIFNLNCDFPTILPCNYQLSKSIVHEIKFGGIAVM